MPTFNRNYLEVEIYSIRSAMDGLPDMSLLGVSGSKIANFGCSVGTETLALIWRFNADEAVGIDKDGSNVFQAQETAVRLRKDIEDSKNALIYSRVSPDDQSWWESEVPGFLKAGKFPTYVQGDMTQEILQQSGYFDLAYCSSVLYHIHTEQGEAGLSRAIDEMARVTQAGGWIIAREPTTGSPQDSTPLDFRSTFERAGLQHIDPEPFNFPEDTTYLYTYRKK